MKLRTRKFLAGLLSLGLLLQAAPSAHWRQKVAVRRIL